MAIFINKKIRLEKITNRLEQLPYAKIKQVEITTVILPWGATEAHNLHLPYGTDNYESVYISERAAAYATGRGAKVLVLPCVPFGVNTGQLDIPFTINMNPSTQLIVLKDILNSLKNYRIKNFVIINSHGGNDFKQLLRELQPEFPDIRLSMVNWFKMKQPEGLFEHKDDHAGEMETSIMLYIHPELVLPLEQAGDGTAKNFSIDGFNEGWAWAQREWTKISNDTGVGYPKKATAEKGKEFLNFLEEKVGTFLLQLEEVTPDTLYTDKFEM